jgi:hypothetical protein
MIRKIFFIELFPSLLPFQKTMALLGYNRIGGVVLSLTLGMKKGSLTILFSSSIML